MLWRISAPSSRRHWVLLSIVVFSFVASLFLYRSPPDVKSYLPKRPPPPPPPKEPEFYNWDTRSSFRPVNQPDAANKTTRELCASFPSRQLDSIQPILRTGHGVLDKRIKPQLESIAACMPDLLIMSDVNEIFMGFDVIDVIGDINETKIQTEEQLVPYTRLRDAHAKGLTAEFEDAGKEGWKMDKFKFIPMISRTWKMKPDRRWYVFFEGDTYVVWDNVFRMLENFDPDQPHYFGSPSPGKESEPGKVTWFANGGPGYILSRESMRRLTKYDFSKKNGEYLGSVANERAWSDILVDCCGDSIIGWALWKEGVSLKGLWPMFNPHPPHGVPYHDRYWCQPILTMHKPHPEDLMSLWHWQFENRQLQRPLLWRDLALSWSNMTEQDRKDDWDNASWDGFDADFPNEHYTTDPNSSLEACANGCDGHPDCFQWTYHLRRCTFVRSFRLGEHKKPAPPKPVKEGEPEKFPTPSGGWTEQDLRFMSGWIPKKISEWAEKRPCNEVQWVTPSTKRIF